MVFSKPIAEITVNDLQELIGITVEKQTIDFKRQLSRDANSKLNRDELCKDICAFANAYGGFIIYGMSESGGIANSLDGLKDSVSIEKLQIEVQNAIQYGIEPSVRSVVRIEPIQISTQPLLFALVIQISAGFQKPYRVIGTHRFTYRSSAGTSDMSLEDLRQSFLATLRKNESIIEFSKRKFNELKSNSYGLMFEKHRIFPWLSVMSIPITNFSKYDMDLETMSLDIFSNTGGWISSPIFDTYNMEGYVSRRERGYTQIYRDGTIENVEVLQFSLETNDLPLDAIKNMLLEHVKFIFNTQHTLEITSSVAIIVNFWNVRGRIFASSMNGFQRYPLSVPIPMERDELNFPDLLVPDTYADVNEALLPLFKILYNAGGFRLTS